MQELFSIRCRYLFDVNISQITFNPTIINPIIINICGCAGSVKGYRAGNMESMSGDQILD